MIIENIAVTVKRKNIKNMYLRVLVPDGKVTLSAPMSVTDEEIIAFVKSKKDWILKKQKYIMENDIRPPIKYHNGEKHPLWGKEYTLQLISNENVKHVLIDEEKSMMYLPVSKRTSIKKREKTMSEFYRMQMQMAIPEVLDKCTKIVGRKPADVNVRKMKNWGNCKQDGRITLNLNLAKKDPICLKYVMIHELCHLIEFNHGKKFKKLMDKFCPNWKEIKKKLNE
jgi:hypothetical protein